MGFCQFTSIFALAFVLRVSGLNCFWRANNQVVAEGVGGWFACNNTQVNPGGAQLCCLQGSQCGEDSICRSNNGYYLGGCTDATYADPVCATQCSADGETWIQWNNTSNMWECCGSQGCDGEPPTRSFTGIQPISWTPIVTAPQSSSTSSTLTTPTSTSATITASASSTASTSATAAASASSTASNSSTINTVSKSGNLSSGAAAGIGVAVGVVVLAAFIGLATWLLLRRRRRAPISAEGELRGERHQMPQQPQPPPPPCGVQSYSDKPKKPLQELGSAQPRELDAQYPHTAELAGSGPGEQQGRKRA